MPDTPALQACFGQPGNQKKGCGFPVAHLLALFHAGTGLLLEVAAAPLRTSDFAGLADVLGLLTAGDVLVADRGFCSFAGLALALSRGIHAVFRVHQKQIVDAGFALVVLVYTAARLGGGGTPKVAANSTLVLHLEGDLPEQAPVDFGVPFFSEEQSLSMAENWQLLRNASADSRIKAIMLEPRGLSVGWAKLEELRSDIINFKKSGKPVYAYLRGAGMREYYVASAADPH